MHHPVLAMGFGDTGWHTTARGLLQACLPHLDAVFDKSSNCYSVRTPKMGFSTTKPIPSFHEGPLLSDRGMANKGCRKMIGPIGTH